MPRVNGTGGLQPSERQVGHFAPSSEVPPTGFEPVISCVKEASEGRRMRVRCGNLPYLLDSAFT